MKPIKSKIKEMQIFACPVPKCRKRSSSLKGLNVHLSRKHESKFLVEMIDGNKPIARLK